MKWSIRLLLVGITVIAAVIGASILYRDYSLTSKRLAQSIALASEQVDGSPEETRQYGEIHLRALESSTYWTLQTPIITNAWIRTASKELIVEFAASKPANANIWIQFSDKTTDVLEPYKDCHRWNVETAEVLVDLHSSKS